MKQRFLLTASAFILLLAAGWLWWCMNMQGTSPATKSGDLPAAQSRNSPFSNGSVGALSGESGADGTVHAVDSMPIAREQILAEIEEAAVTYDAAALPRIERFLLHPDPEVRQSARDGMIVLGDAAAGPMLREASRHTTDPREAAALLEAADYVELPPAPLKRRK